MLEDSGAPVLVTERHLDGAPEPGRTALPIGPPARPAAGRRRAGNLAYLIYTSGSTGRPKGGGDRAPQRRGPGALGARRSSRPRSWPGVLASTSICFDLSVFELFVPLAWGGTVILAENALALPRAAGGRPR